MTFEDLVTVATLGVTRKGFTVTELDGLVGEHAAVLDGDDPAAALLDAAALLTVARRAGVQPARGVQPTEGFQPTHDVPPTHDVQPTHDVPPTHAVPLTDAGVESAGDADGDERELSARAVAALRRIGRADLERGFAAGDADLIADLLMAARDEGYVAAASILPDLLDAAVRKEALRSAVAAVLGTRGRWLAAYRPDWRQALAETSAGARPTGEQPAADAGGQPAADAGEQPEIWRTGDAPERRRFLIGLRRRDPLAARQLLATGWALETADDRATLLAVLAHELSGADEDFLEAALDDRAGRVRDVARALLRRMPGSAYNQRATARATAVLRLMTASGAGRDPDVPVQTTQDAAVPLAVAGAGTGARLVVTLPGAVDAAGVRDGLSDRPPAPGIGAVEWLLTQVIAAAPLASWTERFGLTPAEMVALPITTGLVVTGPMATSSMGGAPFEGGLALAVRAGWRLAAVRYRPSAGTTPRAGTTPAARTTAAAGTTPAAGSATETGGNLATEWAVALLAADPAYAGAGRPPAAWPPAEALAALLPLQERAARLAAVLADTAIGDMRGTYAVAAEVAEFPVPWPRVLADAVVGVLTRSANRRELAPLPRAVLGPAARGLPATGANDYAAELSALANAVPQAWSPMLHTVAETVALRRAFLAELR